jgi:hypothetical protein
VPADGPVEAAGNPRPVRVGGARRGAGQAITPGLVTKVGDPGLGEVVADGGAGVHRGLLGTNGLYTEDAPKAGAPGSGDFLVFAGWRDLRCEPTRA